MFGARQMPRDRGMKSWLRLFQRKTRMAESEPPPPGFERVPNLKRPIVIESYCCACGLFVGASSESYMLSRAELAHRCSEKLKFV